MIKRGSKYLGFERGNHAHFGSAGPLKPCMILDAEKLVYDKVFG